MSRSTLAVIALSVMLPACSASEAPVAPLPTGPSAVSPLAGTSWVLQRLGDVEVLGGAAATLAFADGGRISGSGSCNQFSGTARVDGQSLTIGPLAVTRMACAEPVMQQ
jgi:heat shock protein HslJ